MGNCCSKKDDPEFIYMRPHDDTVVMIKNPNPIDSFQRPIAPPAPLLQSINFAAANDEDLSTSSSDINNDEIRNLLEEEEEDN